jgi:hypothetical protein
LSVKLLIIIDRNPCYKIDKIGVKNICEEKMIKKIVLFLFLFLLAICMFGQTMGQYAKTFFDPARNRQVLTWIYYPINTANPDAVYPYMIFGHGWNGNCTYYTTFTTEMVNLGWIVAYPRTEEGIFSYSTTSLAQDMAFLKSAIYDENQVPSSPIYGKTDTLAIVGGYSMGGACAVAAATMNTSFSSLVTLAAAPITVLNLYPTAINMATSVTIPSVTFSGSTDVIAPPNANQVPIYNNLASDYKSFVSLTGQGHDSFYNNPLIPVILNPWFEYVKTGSVYFIDEYESLLAGYPPSTLTYQVSDNLVFVLDVPQNIILEIDSNSLVISWDKILDAQGYKVYASDYPNSDYLDTTGQGTMTTDERVTWTTPIPAGNWKFFIIKSYRQ